MFYQEYPLNIAYSELHLFHCLTCQFTAVINVNELKESKAKVETINMQVTFSCCLSRRSGIWKSLHYFVFDVIQIVFIFAIIWGLCSSVPESCKVKFDGWFRNLLDGLIKVSSQDHHFNSCFVLYCVHDLLLQLVLLLLTLLFMYLYLYLVRLSI